MIVPFAKFQGAGNDFILIDDSKERFPIKDSRTIAKLCDRRFGIGADGLILAQPSSSADYRMRFFNADGFEAALCGNGLRCLIRFIQDGRSAWSIETQHRIVQCSLHPFGISVSLGSWKSLFVPCQFQGWTVHAIYTGVPHAVVMVDSLEIPDFVAKARLLRSSELFGAEGTNVNFAMRKADGSLAYRTYERGVEGETLACGTGAAAVAIAAGQNEGIIETASQQKLFVVITENDAMVCGPAVFVYSGVINLGDYKYEDRHS